MWSKGQGKQKKESESLESSQGEACPELFAPLPQMKEAETFTKLWGKFFVFITNLLLLGCVPTLSLCSYFYLEPFYPEALGHRRSTLQTTSLEQLLCKNKPCLIIRTLVPLLLFTYEYAPGRAWQGRATDPRPQGMEPTMGARHLPSFSCCPGTSAWKPNLPSFKSQELH